MPKSEINKRTGKVGSYSLAQYRQNMLKKVFADYDREKIIEENRKRGKKPGAREVILEAFKKTHKKEDAYYTMECINQKIGRQAFSKQMVDTWIDTYVRQNTKERDDDDAR